MPRGLRESSPYPGLDLFADKMGMVLLNEVPACTDVDRFAIARILRTTRLFPRI
jgi:hypothetical protein